MTKQEKFLSISEEIKRKELEISDLQNELTKLESLTEISKEDILREYNKYVSIEVKEIRDPLWYHASPPPMVKYIYIYEKEGYYLSSEVEKTVEFYAKEILGLKFDN